MKSTFKLVGIITIAVLIMFSFASCDDGGGPGGGDGGTPNLSFSGVWESDRGMQITLSSSSAIISRIGNPNTLWQDAANKGHIKTGDLLWRNISSTGSLIWSGEVLLVRYYTSSPNVAIGTGWTSATLTMSSNGRTIHVSATDSSGTSAQTWNRR